MVSKEKNIEILLKKYGYAFPQTEEEIKAFESKFKNNYTEPTEWPDILDIIDKKINNKKVIELNSLKNKSASSLAIAARDGKEISKKVREQMNKDKKDARKK